jgi:uncharacterized protein involved in exopolysaccharide biosynthesis
MDVNPLHEVQCRAAEALDRLTMLQRQQEHLRDFMVSHCRAFEQEVRNDLELGESSVAVIRSQLTTLQERVDHMAVPVPAAEVRYELAALHAKLEDRNQKINDRLREFRASLALMHLKVPEATVNMTDLNVTVRYPWQNPPWTAAGPAAGPGAGPAAGPAASANQ